VIHPELFFFLKNYNNILISYLTELLVSGYNNNNLEANFNAILTLIEIIFYLSLIIFFLLTYFTYYNNYTTEEYLIDHDYLVSSMLVEAEEEIGAIDDSFLTIIIFIILFL
jgi:hypothetical protein